MKKIKLAEVKSKEKEEALDELVREFCRENDVGKMSGCPKCGFKAGDYLNNFCQWHYCPLREWRTK